MSKELTYAIRECQENAIASNPGVYLGIDRLIAYAFRQGVKFGVQTIKTAKSLLLF